MRRDVAAIDDNDDDAVQTTEDEMVGRSVGRSVSRMTSGWWDTRGLKSGPSKVSYFYTIPFIRIVKKNRR